MVEPPHGPVLTNPEAEGNRWKKLDPDRFGGIKETNNPPSWVGFFCRLVLERNQTRHPKAPCSISQLRGGRAGGAASVSALTDSSITVTAVICGNKSASVGLAQVLSGRRYDNCEREFKSRKQENFSGYSGPVFRCGSR